MINIDIFGKFFGDPFMISIAQCQEKHVIYDITEYERLLKNTFAVTLRLNGKKNAATRTTVLHVLKVQFTVGDQQEKE